VTRAEDDARPHAVHGVDAAFLHTGTRSTPWQIVGVLVFDPSTAPAGFDRSVVARVVGDRIEHLEAFRRRVVDVRGPWSLPHWVLEHTVDLAEHVRGAELPTLDGLVGLSAFAAETAGLPLETDRPLWEMDVIPDIGDGRSAVVAKVHHSIMDGTAAVEVLGALFDLEPREPPPRLDPEPQTESAGLNLGALLRTLERLPVVTARTVAQLPRATFGFVRALRVAGRSVTLPLTGPRTSLSRSITASRSVVLTTLPLADVREVAESFRLTVNDVIVSTCAGALRLWLHEAGELPTRPLVAAIPVAVRDRGDHRSGNRVSVIFSALPTHLVDPAERIDAVRRAMRDAKATHADVRPQTLGALAEAAPWNLLGLMFRAYSDFGLANVLPPAVNLVLSNVPGPPVPVYLGGARLEGLYALGPIFDGAALNITVTTCNDDVDVGIVSCPDVAPPVDGLVPALEASLAELVALARVPAHPDA
jgi:diacylglycerol O-acyltransferase / wax synthase